MEKNSKTDSVPNVINVTNVATVDTYDNKEIVYIDSRHRDDGEDNSDFSVFINLRNNIKYSKVVVLSCSIPKTFYNVYKDSSFILTEDDQSVTINVPASNYSRASLKNMLVLLLNQNSPKGYTYNITYQNINTYGDDGKYSYLVSGNGVVQPSFTFGTTLFEQMGFDKEKTYQFATNILRSVNVVNLNKESTLFIRSDIVQNSSNNILQGIVCADNPSYTNIAFTASGMVDEYSKSFSNYSSNKYRFWLTNEDGDIIDLNGLNIIMTLMIY